MSPKHWTKFENPMHFVYKQREQFLKEHESADQIVMSHEGIPIQAIYNSPECPHYGKPYTEEKRGLIPLPKKDVTVPNGTEQDEGGK